jgi:hypothetical protein
MRKKEDRSSESNDVMAGNDEMERMKKEMVVTNKEKY